MAQSSDVRDFSAAARAVLGMIKEHIGLDASYVARRQGDHYVILDCMGGEELLAPGTVMPWSETICSLMMAGKGPSMVPVVSDVPAYRELFERQSLPVQSVMSMPIYDGKGTFFGTLCGFSTVPKGPELLAKESTVRLWADLLGLILGNELAVDQEAYRAARAERAAETDPLTGLGNRRLWDRLVTVEEARCRRYGSPAAVVVIDLDHLKAINDEHGHAAGDTVLARVGACLRGVLPPGAVGSRIGGDEFAVLATEHDRALGEDLLGRLEQALTEAGVVASLGLGVRTPDIDMIQAWHRADRAMYRAKDGDRRGPAAGRRALDAARSRLAERLACVLTTSSRAGEQIDELLALTREHLDSDVAIVGEIRDGRWTVRHVSSRHDGWERGQERRAEETYCQRLLTAQAALVIPDTAACDRPGVDWRTDSIGSYLGVPLSIESSDEGSTLCCFSAAPDLTLNDRDEAFLCLVARMITDLMDQEEAAETRQRLALRRVEQARAPGGMIMAFQPIVCLADRRVVGVEALTRTPGMADLSPAGLYEAADDAGLLVDMELFAADRAKAAFEITDGFVAVNFSATTLLDPGFDRFAAAVPLERTVIEISEHNPVEDYDAIVGVLAPLRARGLRLAVDDAGAGFASLRHILRLRPDIIKLDISLVRHLVTDDLNQGLAGSLAAVAAQIQAQVVAEGIEDEGTLAVLRDTGVGLGQGYLLGPPRPLEHRQGDGSGREAAAVLGG